MTYAQILAQIYALGRFGIKPGLDRITRLLGALGNPQDAFSTVHIVGTNGKGSTASFLSSVLSAGGYRTGLFTSPHLTSFTERFRIDGEEVGEEILAPLAERALAAAPEATTFFELVTALAALVFAETGVRIAVVEAGMGGSLDATNAFPGILTVITPVSLDHTDYLGHSVAEIAAEKAGILKPGTPLVSARQEPAASRVIEARARELGSPLTRYPDDFEAGWREGRLWYRGPGLSLQGLHPRVSGLYQRENAACAIAAAEILPRLGFPLPLHAFPDGIQRAFWPGRLELVPGKPRLLLDGAHNPAGAAALAEALGEIPRRRLFLVIGVMGDKELSGILDPLLPLADTVFAVTPAIERALPAAELADRCRERGARAVAAGCVERGLAGAREAAAEEDLVLVCGSLFTVGEARGILLSRHFEPMRG